MLYGITQALPFSLCVPYEMEKKVFSLSYKS